MNLNTFYPGSRKDRLGQYRVQLQWWGPATHQHCAVETGAVSVTWLVPPPQ